MKFPFSTFGFFSDFSCLAWFFILFFSFLRLEFLQQNSDGFIWCICLNIEYILVSLAIFHICSLIKWTNLFMRIDFRVQAEQCGIKLLCAAKQHAEKTKKTILTHTKSMRRKKERIEHSDELCAWTHIQHSHPLYIFPFQTDFPCYFASAHARFLLNCFLFFRILRHFHSKCVQLLLVVVDFCCGCISIKSRCVQWKRSSLAFVEISMSLEVDRNT